MIDPQLLILPAFIAGIITFLAPCTLPLVPAYLTFIGGTATGDLQNPAKKKGAQRKILLNGLFYVLGFSAVFILMGSLIGLGGAALAPWRTFLTQIGGAFVMLFGFFLIAPALKEITNGKIRLPSLSLALPVPAMSRLKPGNPASSLVFGASFAFGWTPCVGPVLGAILTLAASSASVSSGAFLLFVFSLGLALPFLATAAAISWASRILPRIAVFMNWVSLIGGALLLVLGYLMLTNNFLVWIGFTYELLEFMNYEELLLDLL